MLLALAFLRSVLRNLSTGVGSGVEVFEEGLKGLRNKVESSPLRTILEIVVAEAKQAEDFLIISAVCTLSRLGRAGGGFQWRDF